MFKALPKMSYIDFVPKSCIEGIAGKECLYVLEAADLEFLGTSFNHFPAE